MGKVERGFTTIIDLPHTAHFMVLVVKDIYKSADELSHKLNIGSWNIRKYPDPSRDDAIFGKKQYEFMHGFANLGGMILELEQPLSGDSPTAKFIENHGEGLWAIGYVVNNFDKVTAKLRDLNYEVIRSGKQDGCRYHTVELGSGFVIELQETKIEGIKLL
ncbi:MAG: VOC family protein [Dehalococcoidales bacterium]|nr:VOC family protein [Dehalococcoidales bacterium]